MARARIKEPAELTFSTQVGVLIGHVNYGGHLGNDAVLSIAHEARIRFLKHIGATEMNAYGAGLIMTDSVIVYKNEAFQGDVLTVEMAAFDESNIGFDLYYKMSCQRQQDWKVIAEVKTGMVCFDYKKRKTMRLPEALKEKLSV